MATKLQIYKIALRAVGERTISALTENREPRRLLDEVWDAGASDYFLEQGLWNFAMRAIKLDASDSVSTSFGYANAFSKPTDFIRLASIAHDEYFNSPLTQYEIEGDYFYADIDPIYLRYVSNGASYGGDLSRWPGTFTLWAGYWLGTQIAPDLKNEIDMERLEKRTMKYLHDARSKDAQQEGTRFIPLSTWANARKGRTTNRERGQRSPLTS